MMSKDEKKSTVPNAYSDDEQPEIYGIKKEKSGIVLNRRSFLSAIATAGALAAYPPAIAEGKNKPAASPEKPGRSKAHEGKVAGLVLRDNPFFSWDSETLKAWDLARGDLKKSVTKARLQEGLKQAGDTFPALFLHTWDDPVLAHGPDGTTLAVNGKDGVTLWKSANGKPEKVRTLENPPQRVNALAFHPDGKRVAAGGGDGFVVVWDLDDGNMQRFEGDKSNLSSLAFHPNKPWLLSAHSDGKVRVWGLPDGKTEKTLNCHGKEIRHLEVTPDGALAITASDDKTIKFWSLPNGKQKASLNVPLSETTSAMDLSPDGQVLATGTPQGRIYLWRLPKGEMMGCLFDP
ncbi:MAG: WD40 repeat domain-containing protein, partial [Desulfovibrio sp.]|nr:WD40 repeat domain-containing protein [Desulfovibrio sp.]